MSTDLDADDNICHACVGDPFLKARIKAEGRGAICGECGKRRRAIAADAFQWWIDDVFKSNFEPGPGPDAGATIAAMTGISETLATRIADDLSSLYGYLEATGKSDDPYNSEGYVAPGSDRDDTVDRWHGFQKSLRQEARYFNRASEQWLDHIFTGLDDQRTWHDQGVIRHMKVGGVGASFYRARVASTEGKVATILADPMAELGPPPGDTSSAGRMNAAGVSVFYGAVDVETCISEIRAPVGSTVIVGRFDLIRPVRLLDFDLLAQIEASISHFDPDYHRKVDRLHFLRSFGQHIARPIQPGDELLGYLPTQVVADYLAQRVTPALDGMFYRSTQTGSKGRNVVLFNRASRIEALDPRTKLDVHMGWMEHAEPDDSASLTLRLRDEGERGPPPDWRDEREATLRLDLESISVTRINATVYETGARRFHFFDRQQPLPDLGF